MESHDGSLVSNPLDSPLRKIESKLNKDNELSLEFITPSLVKTDRSPSPVFTKLNKQIDASDF